MANPIFEGEAWERYKQFLIKRESADNAVSDYSLKYFNQIGYYGIYQFGVQALETIGRLKPGSYKKTRGKSGVSQQDILENPDNWADGYSLENFSTKGAQDEALKDFTKRNYRSIRMPLQNAGITDPTEVFAYLTSAHLGGARTTRSFIKDGQTSFKDANGTSPAHYRDAYLKAEGPMPNIGTGVKESRPGVPGIEEEYLKSMPTIDEIELYKKYSDQGLPKFVPTTDSIRDTIDTSKSTMSESDEYMMNIGINRYIDRPDTPVGDNPFDKFAMAMYSSAVREGAEALALNTSLEPKGGMQSDLPMGQANSNEFVSGGNLQPNGNRTKFKRPEDIAAQQNTLKQ